MSIKERLSPVFSKLLSKQWLVPRKGRVFISMSPMQPALATNTLCEHGQAVTTVRPLSISSISSTLSTHHALTIFDSHLRPASCHTAITATGEYVASLISALSDAHATATPLCFRWPLQACKCIQRQQCLHCSSSTESSTGRCYAQGDTPPFLPPGVMNSLFTNSDSLGGLDDVYSDSGERGTKARDD